MTTSREVQAIVGYVEASGLPYRVTDIDGPGHAPGSYHYAQGTDGAGLAVDFGGVTPGVTPTTAAQMAAVYRELLNVAGQLAELIYSGADLDGRPVLIAVKNGRRVDGASFFGPVTWKDHFDHVHVAVPRGTFLSHPLGTLSPGGLMADDPNLPNLPDIKFFVPVINTTTGEATGYYIVAGDGELHAFGPGAKFFGRSEVVPGS